MKKIENRIILSLLSCFAITVLFLTACSSSDSSSSDTDEETTGTLSSEFDAFDTDETDIYLSGSNVVIETTGRPNHESVYWGEDNELYKEEPDVALTESIIPNYDGSATLTVPQSPSLASSSTDTSLGAVGISVSGAAIFNDQEGNGDLDAAAASLDWSGGHIGPAEYHYHLEPKAFTDDDDELVGIIADGFFIYGRKCDSTGTYPTDLDASGGHTSTTQYSTTAKYHYHIINSLYSTTGSYIVFAGPYQGTPNAIE
jgi:hypothetical protein